ncbi:unnamed protein product, partial [Adineta ricciae]
MLTTMQITFALICIVASLSVVQSSTEKSGHKTKEDCLEELLTKELSNSYNYLQLSSKVGTTQGFAGFSSLYFKLSDDGVSKAHDLAKFLALRQFDSLDLIHKSGIEIHSGIHNLADDIVFGSLEQAKLQNDQTLEKVHDCHKLGDANVQDYLESNILDYHIEIDKFLQDLKERLASTTDKELT